MGEIFMRKWIIAVIIGVLLPYPIILLLEYLAQLQADTGNILYGYAQSALIFLSYFFLGVFLSVLQSLRISGTARRFRWPEFVLGVLLLLITAVWKMEQATGLISALGFVAASDILTKFVTFNDGGLYLWVVMAGYFMTDAFQRVPAESAVQGAPQSVVQSAPQSVVQGATQSAVQGAVQSVVQGAPQSTMQVAAQEATQSMEQGTAQGTAGATQDAAQAIGPTLAAAESTSVRRSDRKKNAKPEKKAGLWGGRARSTQPKAKKADPQGGSARSAEPKAKKADPQGGRAGSAEPKAKKPDPWDALDWNDEPRAKRTDPWDDFGWGVVPKASAPAQPQPAATQTVEAKSEDTSPGA